jgi:hypothetical protein
MVQRFVGAGSLPGAAEQIIGNSSMAFNKACHEFKKFHPDKVLNGSQKKVGKTSKPA